MKIKKELYNQLINCPAVPPELGGILAGDDEMIDTVVMDSGIQNPLQNGIKYITNTEYLNDQLSLLIDEGKRFWGMFHTHANQWDSLSNADMEYIKMIMNSMPSKIEKLFFPVVYPGLCIKAYIAQRENGETTIHNDEIELI